MAIPTSTTSISNWNAMYTEIINPNNGRIGNFPILIGTELNSEAFVYSTISVLAAFFLVGMIKGKIVKKSMMRSGINTLIIGGIAAIVAYVVGYGLNFLVS
ncbi:MAG TPA: VIT1/CCC1 transporter family protein [Nitrosopumilus sp.]|nr:VIT1/CCC1 transporter family protein [Thermoproteota archaeon]HJJ23395.1 VIT1/CCC1 transporter family protein [Nitrosopumilus sp.]